MALSGLIIPFIVVKKMKAISLDEVSIFVKVVEVGSFAGAGRQMNMPSTTVSRKVLQLEASLGVRLLQRTTRKLSLTEIGQRYFERCQRSLAGLDEANALVTEYQAMPTGILRITSPLDFATQYLQPWISAFLDLYSDVQVELVIADEYLDLFEHRIDIAFRSGHLRDSNLIARRIGPKHNVFCAAPAYLNSAGEPKVPADLVGHDCVIYGESIENSVWKFADELLVPVRGRIAANNMHVILEEALNGRGIAQLPLPLAFEHFKHGNLRRVLMNFEAPAGSIYMLYPSHKNLATKVKVFLDYVIEQTEPKAPWESN